MRRFIKGDVSKSLPLCQQSAKNFGREPKCGEILRWKSPQLFRQCPDTLLPCCLQQAYSFGTGLNAHASRVGGVGRDSDETAVRETGHDPAHG